MRDHTINDKAKRLYLMSDNVEELQGIKKILSDYVSMPVIKKKAKEDAEKNFEYRLSESLAIQLDAKIRYINWCRDFSEESFVRFKEFIKDGIDKTEHPDMPTVTAITKEDGTTSLKVEVRPYGKALRTLVALRDYVDEMYPIITESAKDMDSVTFDKTRATKDPDRIAKIVERFRERLAKLDQMCLGAFLEENMVIPDSLEMAKAAVRDTMESIAAMFSAAKMDQMNAIMAESLVPFSKVEGLKNPEYCDSRFTKESTVKGTVILATPFEDEAILAVRKCGNVTGKEFYRLNVSALSTKMPEEIRLLFSVLASAGKHLFVTGIAECREEVFKAVAEGLIIIGTEGVSVFVHDKIGDHKLYEQFEDIAIAKGLSTALLSHEFLRMPNCQGTLSMLVEQGRISNSEKEYSEIKKNLPFMGYIGLNMLLSGESFSIVEGRSKNNTPLALAYLKRVVSQSHLIDSEWGDYSANVRFSASGERVAFDYDGFLPVDRENISRIIEKPGLSLFAKCGIAVKYCVTGGDAAYVLDRLDKAELAERINLATTVVCRLLNTRSTPVVELFSKEEWAEKAKTDKDYAGNTVGLCIKQGKLIHYKEDHMRALGNAIDTVCHESFHVFQHTAIDTSYADWHFIELGITAARIEEWSMNHAVYMTSGSSYRYQVFEADAYAFAKECCKGADNRWHEIEFVSGDGE